jgi:hypothetical protein
VVTVPAPRTGTRTRRTTSTTSTTTTSSTIQPATQAPTPEELRFYDVNRQLHQAVPEGAVPVGKRAGRNRPAVSRVISKAPGQRQHADARPPLAPRAPQLAAGKINHAKRGRRAPRPRLLAGPGPAIGPRSSVRGGPSSCGP